MTSQDAPRITSKQQKVLDGLTAGRSVEQIARRMKISTAAVYGHMRNLRRRGVTLPAEALDDSSGSNGHAPAAEVAATNGHFDPIQALREAEAFDTQRLGDLGDEVERLRAELDEIAERRERYTAALAALQS